jgi:hypothetical protein
VGRVKFWTPPELLTTAWSVMVRNSEREGRATWYYIIGISLARVRRQGPVATVYGAPKAKALGDPQSSAKNEAPGRARERGLLSVCGQKEACGFVSRNLPRRGGAGVEFQDGEEQSGAVALFLSLARTDLALDRSLSWHEEQADKRMGRRWSACETILVASTGACRPPGLL